MRIGVLSDTHGFLDPAIPDLFGSCDEIWHAGDIGDGPIITELEKVAPVRAVHGNIDSPTIRNQHPEDDIFDCAGAKVLLTHIAGNGNRFPKRAQSLLKDHKPQVLVCGHSHILKVQFIPRHNLLFLNPGACGRQGFHTIRTALRFEIHDGTPSKMEVLELGPRGKPASVD